MFVKQNKYLLIGTVAVCGLVAGVHLLGVSDNWRAAADSAKAADEIATTWEKNFRAGENLLPKPEAEQALEDSNRLLKAGLQTLQQIEFGTKDTLQPYTEAAAKDGDKKNYLMTRQTQSLARAKSLNVVVPSELGLTEKTFEDPVALNLLRVAMVDHFVTSCNVAKITRIGRIQHYAPKLIPFGDEAQPDDDKEERDSRGGDKDKKGSAPAERTERLVQFPCKIQVLAPEPTLSKLLYEIQKPSDRQRGHMTLRGFHVAVRQAGSGQVEAVLALSVLLNEKFVRDLGIPVNEEEPRRGGGQREVDLNRY